MPACAGMTLVIGDACQAHYLLMSQNKKKHSGRFEGFNDGITRTFGNIPCVAMNSNVCAILKTDYCVSPTFFNIHHLVR
jgi:hypothetical protein